MPRIGPNPDVTRNELSAAESGAQAKQQASNNLQNEYQAGAQNATQQASVFGGLIQQGEELKRQDTQIAEQGRHNRMSEAQESDRQDIEMADKGVQQQGGGMSRADALRQEMENGRLQNQMSKPIEVNGAERRTLGQTEQRKAAEASKLATNKMNAQTSRLNAMKSLSTARASGNEELVKQELKNLEQPLISAADLFNAGQNGKLAPNQWLNLKELAAGLPHDTGLQQEIETNTFGPRVSEFLQRRVNYEALTYMAATGGEMPNGKLVDMGSPMMVQFTQSANQMQAWVRSADELTGGAVSMGLKINSLAKRNMVIRRMTADAMLTQMKSQASAARNPIPSQGGGGGGGPQAQGQTDAQQRNARAAGPGAPGTPVNSGVDQILQAREGAGINRQQQRDRDARRAGGDAFSGQYGPNFSGKI